VIVFVLVLLCGTMSWDEYLLPKLTLASLLALYHALKNKAVEKQSLLGPCFVVAILVMLATGICGVDPALSIFGKHHVYTHGIILTVFAYILYSISCSKNYGYPQYILAGAFCSILALGERFGYDILECLGLLRASAWPRTISTIGNPVSLGQVLGVVLFASMLEIEALKLNRWWCIGLLLIGVGIGTTGSRSALLGCGAAFAVMYAKRKDWVEIAMVFAILIGVSVWARGTTAMMADVERLVAWKVGLQSFLEHPILGSGPGTFGLSFTRLATVGERASMGQMLHADAHCLPLQVLSTMGLVGFVAFLAVLWFYYKQKELRPTLPMVVFLLVSSLFQPLCAIAALLALISIGHQEAKKCPGGVGNRYLALPAFACAIVYCIWFIADCKLRSVAMDPNMERAITGVRQATRLAPWEASYSTVLNEVLTESYRSSPDIRVKRHLALMMTREAERVIWWHLYQWRGHRDLAVAIGFANNVGMVLPDGDTQFREQSAIMGALNPAEPLPIMRKRR